MLSAEGSRRARGRHPDIDDAPLCALTGRSFTRRLRRACVDADVIFEIADFLGCRGQDQILRGDGVRHVGAGQTLERSAVVKVHLHLTLFAAVRIRMAAPGIVESQCATMLLPRSKISPPTRNRSKVRAE